MIRPLRTIHRGVFSLLVVALPAGLAWTLVHRGPAAPSVAPDERSAAVELLHEARSTATGIRVHVPASSPEALVYLDERGAATPGRGARLLGRVEGTSSDFELPPGESGDVLVYSPILQSTVARLALGARP